jgi:CRP/FNR family cyclic AMP-dependent transcriptional regulator
MQEILTYFRDREVQAFKAGEVLMQYGVQSGRIFVLIEGAIEVVKEEVRVDFVRESGAVFGEIAALLGIGHSAEVRVAEDCTMYVIENPRQFLIERPEVLLHVSELMARRVNNLVQYLVDVKQQYEGHDHLGMVDQVLDSLALRQLRERKVRKPPPEAL